MFVLGIARFLVFLDVPIHSVINTSIACSVLVLSKITSTGCQMPPGSSCALRLKTDDVTSTLHISEGKTEDQKDLFKFV